MAVDVAQAIRDLIQRILNDRDTAVQYSEDPEGTLAAQGITEGDLSGLDMFQTVQDTCGSVPGLQNYGPNSGGGGASGGGPTPPPASSPGHSVDQVMQHMNYVTYVAYEGDETITTNIDNSTNIDQSQNVNVDVEGDLHGGVDVDSHDTNVNATGDGSAASGTGPATAGDENLVNTGTNLGQQNTGDGAAQAIQVGLGREGGGGGIVQNTGDGGVAAGGNIDGPINTGEFTGVQSDGGPGVTGGALSFGEGDAYNAQGNTVSEGGALSQGGDASGYKSDDDETNLDLNVEVSNVEATNSVVQTEQGEGDAIQNDLVDLGARPPLEVVSSESSESTEESFEG